MRFLLLGFAFLFSACSNSDSSQTAQTSASSEPPETSSQAEMLSIAKKYIDVNLPGWSIAERTDYKIWWSFYDGRSVPFMAVTDLNDDRQADYALMVKKESALKLVILLGKGATFTHWIADNFDTTFDPAAIDLTYGLTVEVPGRIDIVTPSVQSLIVKSNAFNLMELENRRCVYYWANGEIASFVTM
jgi:hypothetical protein